jgi:DNA-binding MarR family transcriptional regulator
MPLSSQPIDADPERIELARAIASSLPKFGHWASASRQFDTPYGRLGYRRISILWVLRHEIVAPSDATPTGLARLFRVQPSVMTRALANMEAAGFITRTVDPNDTRVLRISITELGLEVSHYVERMYIAEVLEAISCVPQAGLAPLHEAVTQLDTIADELDRRRFGRTRRAERAIEDIAPPK